MYKVEKKNFGVKFIFKGFIQKEEMEMWANDAQAILPDMPRSFGVFVDMRDMKPIPQDAQAVMEETQKMFKQAGMIRSCIVLQNPITTMQFQRIAKGTGIYQWERYIDASSFPQWEKMGEDWIIKAKDPDEHNV